MGDNFEPGDVVEFITGGLPMTVNYVNRNQPDAVTVNCVWWNKDAKGEWCPAPERFGFDARLLKKVTKK